MAHVFSSLSELARHCPYPLLDDQLHQINGVAVVSLDSAAVLADFPWVAGADDVDTQNRLRRWALGLAAVSTGQLDAPGVNGPVTLGSGQMSAVRPPHYGRAAIVDSAATGGFANAPPTQRRLCDIKGCGVAPGVRPLPAPHATGLISMVEALCELINARLLDEVFFRAGLTYRCLRIYGLLDLGFVHQDPYQIDAPAAMILREAHLRPADNEELPLHGSDEQTVIGRIEETLNRFNLTSATTAAFEALPDGDKWQARYDGARLERVTHDHLLQLARLHRIEYPAECRLVNVQMAKTVDGNGTVGTALVDFSHYAFGDFAQPLYQVVPALDRPFNFGHLRRVGPGAAKDAPYAPRLRAKGFFEKTLPSEEEDAVIRYLAPGQPLSRLVRFAHQLVLEMPHAHADLNHLNARIDSLVMDAFGARGRLGDEPSC